MPQTEPANVFERHNHRQCAQTGLKDARSFCDKNDLRLTPIRQRVLEILLESHKALGAYDILERLRSEGKSSQPPIVYRALDFLVENGFVHRLERLNAFAACNATPQQHEPIFLICQNCRQVAEAPGVGLVPEINEQASVYGFTVTARMVEVIGLCPGCRKAETE